MINNIGAFNQIIKYEKVISSDIKESRLAYNVHYSSRYLMQN